MVNIDDFIKRLQIILDYYGLSASAFADKIDVQRSSISHLLSGRNKPSLDFIMKVIEIFPEVDFYWILNGKGTFPKTELKVQEKIVYVTTPPNEELKKVSESKNESDLFSQDINIENTEEKNNLEEKKINTENSEPKKNSSNIERIVIFYANGSFKEYQPE